MKEAALYCRVSTSEQREGGTSLDTQRDQGLQKASDLGWNVSQEHVILEDWTGKDLQRPGLLQILSLVNSGAIQGLIVFTLDRLYRPENEGDEWRVFEVLQQFQDAGVEVAWVDPSIPSSGPLSAVFTFLDAWRAGRERRTLIERTTRGIQEKARRGKVVSRSAAPYGYRFDPEESQLIIHEEEARVVRLIFRLYTQERLSLVKLADSLNRLGIAAPRGPRWHASSLSRMLGNETYIGTLWHHRWQDIGQGKPKFVERPIDEQIAVPVPAIISKEIFDRARSRLEVNRHLARRNSKRNYLLTGLIRHSCGSRMGGCVNKGVTYYRCYKSMTFKAPIDSRGVPQPCSCRWVNGEALESAVWDTLTELLRNPDLLVRELERLSGPDSVTRESLQEELDRIRKRLSAIPREERRLVEGYRKGYYPDTLMREEMEHVQAEKSELCERRRALESKLSNLDRAKSYRRSLEEFARRIAKGLDAMIFEDRKELLQLLVEELEYEEGEVTIKAIMPLGEPRLHSEDERVHGSWQATTEPGYD